MIIESKIDAEKAGELAIQFLRCRVADEGIDLRRPQFDEKIKKITEATSICETDVWHFFRKLVASSLCPALDIMVVTKTPAIDTESVIGNYGKIALWILRSERLTTIDVERYQRKYVPEKFSEDELYCLLMDYVLYLQIAEDAKKRWLRSPSLIMDPPPNRSV